MPFLDLLGIKTYDPKTAVITASHQEKNRPRAEKILRNNFVTRYFIEQATGMVVYDSSRMKKLANDRKTFSVFLGSAKAQKNNA